MARSWCRFQAMSAWRRRSAHTAAFFAALVTCRRQRLAWAGPYRKHARIAIGGGEPVLRPVVAEASLDGAIPLLRIDWQDMLADHGRGRANGHRGSVAAGVLAHLLAEKLA